ncbi:MAG: ribosome recycling factor [Clostridia bacterium]|nr:ribosome recycling factor [Clostridia bacterium]MDD4386226.1 ribosome recycling factor [Clostridia bacterium]
MDYNIIEQKMEKAIDYLVEEFANIRAGRANPAILNKVEVDYYGMNTPINQVGTIAVPEARQIQIIPWDKSILSAIEKAINKAGIGINPINDGVSIRLIFPELNEQRRKDLAKEIKSLGEDAKVAIRNTRRDAMDLAKAKQKASEMTEDELDMNEEKIQKITDKYIQNIDKVTDVKEKEIMEI